MLDLCAGARRARPLHIVAEARGPALEGFTRQLCRQRATAAGPAAGSKGAVARRLVTWDILATEELAAGFISQCAVEPKLSGFLTVRGLSFARSSAQRAFLQMSRDAACCASVYRRRALVAMRLLR